MLIEIQTVKVILVNNNNFKSNFTIKYKLHDQM